MKSLSLSSIVRLTEPALVDLDMINNRKVDKDRERRKEVDLREVL